MAGLPPGRHPPRLAGLSEDAAANTEECAGFLLHRFDFYLVGQAGRLLAGLRVLRLIMIFISRQQ